jgi:hypothetical protein
MSDDQKHQECPNCKARRETILNTFDFNMREAFKRRINRDTGISLRKNGK